MNVHFVQTSRFRRVFSFVTLLAIIGIRTWQVSRLAREHGMGIGFVNVRSLLNAPWVIALIALAFVIGFWLVLQKRT
jgi:hypothetical protein